MLYITVFVSKNSRNKRNYDLVPRLNNPDKSLAGKVKTTTLYNVTPKKMKEYLFTKAHKMIVGRLRKDDKEGLTSCRYIRDVLAYLNGLSLKYEKPTYFMMLPAGSLVGGI